MRAFARFAWIVLGYDVLVVLWGAFVRATGSGAGCGRHWPTCRGEVVPRSPAAETVIEFLHRATSGIALLLAVALLVWAFRAFPRGHPTRAASVAALAFMLAEAAVGAGLVLFGLVARDTSAARGWVMAVHHVNTFLLLGSLAVAAFAADRPVGLDPRGRGAAGGLLVAALAALLLAGVTGAVAALGDTLFPEVHFAEGLRLEGEATVLLRLRVLHPFAAVAAGAVALLAARAAVRARPDPSVSALASTVVGLVAVQIAAGAVNVILAAPVGLQLVHLALADGLWIALVLLSAASLAPATREKERPGLGPGLAPVAGSR
ncbi:MAG TPA: COX15/CtaA family protein [Anaeromyxobacteraceae bacterium]|nr:COX15/CtaA family protein [Anaeromyxobacteraceae bacterium]